MSSTSSAEPARVLAYDLDGTLLDARRRQVALTAFHVRAAGGPALDEARYWDAKRAGASTRQALVALGHPPEVAAAVAAAWERDIEGDAWQALDAWLPGAPEALARARAAGLAVWVLTARRDPAALARRLAALDADRLVDRLVVVAPAHAATEKAPYLGPEVVAFIGDTERDLAAARAAGVPFVAVACGSRDAAFLAAAGADVIVADAAAATARVIASWPPR